MAARTMTDFAFVTIIMILAKFGSLSQSSKDEIRDNSNRIIIRKNGTGSEGTTVLTRERTGWKVLHEHLSALNNQ